MYNQELKEAYIAHALNINNNILLVLKSLFNSTEKFEERYGKDVCNFSAYDILNFYSAQYTYSIHMLNNWNSHLKNYTQFCIANNMVRDNQNHFAEISSADLQSCINTAILKKKFISREQLLQVVHNMENPPYAFCVLAVFEGISGINYDEIKNLKLDDFHGNTVTLTSGRTLTVSDELVDLAFKADAAPEYIDKLGKRYPYDESEFIVKGRDPWKVSSRMISRIIRDSFPEAASISKYDLVMSGICCEARKIMERENCSLEDVIYKHKDELAYRFGNYVPSQMLKKIEEGI